VAMNSNHTVPCCSDCCAKHSSTSGCCSHEKHGVGRWFEVTFGFERKRAPFKNANAVLDFMLSVWVFDVKEIIVAQSNSAQIPARRVLIEDAYCGAHFTVLQHHLAGITKDIAVTLQAVCPPFGDTVSVPDGSREEFPLNRNQCHLTVECRQVSMQEQANRSSAPKLLFASLVKSYAATSKSGPA